MTDPGFGDSDELRALAKDWRALPTQLRDDFRDYLANEVDAEQAFAACIAELRRYVHPLALQLEGAATRIKDLNDETRRGGNIGNGAGIIEPIDPRGHYVYTLWGRAGQRLYVGQSSNILGRLGSHLNDQNKRRHIVNVTLIRCTTATEKLRTEANLIRIHQPPWNTAGIDR